MIHIIHANLFCILLILLKLCFGVCFCLCYGDADILTGFVFVFVMVMQIY